MKVTKQIVKPYNVVIKHVKENPDEPNRHRKRKPKKKSKA